MAFTSLVTLLPAVILTLIVQKDFVKGMAMGAVKGYFFLAGQRAHVRKKDGLSLQEPDSVLYWKK